MHQKRTDFTLKPSQNSQVKQIPVILEHCLDFGDSWYYQTELMFQRYICVQIGLRGWLSGKEPACQCRSYRRHRLDPRLGRFLGGGSGNPLQYSCWDNPMDRGTWRATVYSVTKSQTQLSTHPPTHTHPHTHTNTVKLLL